METDGGLVSEADEVLRESTGDASGSWRTRSGIGGRSWRCHISDGEVCDAVWMRLGCGSSERGEWNWRPTRIDMMVRRSKSLSQ